MRLVFMGTAVFAVPSLEALLSAGHQVGGVFTQPDRPAGRGRKLKASPVKDSAAALGLDVHQPDSLDTDSVVDLCSRLEPELVVVVAYGKIIPRWLRELPIHGVVNVHGSLLPRYRGAAPVNWAIANGESQSGVCTMQIDAGLDTGAVFECETTNIGEDETAPELYQRLADIGAPLLIRTVEAIGQGTAVSKAQDAALATRAPRLEKTHGRIRWDEPARSIHNKVRAFVPWPSVVVRFRKTPCRVLRTSLIDDVFVETTEKAEPGTIRIESDRLIVRCGDGRFLEILELQMENRKAVSGRDFIHGARCQNGEQFQGFDQV